MDDLFAGREENWLLIPEANAKTTLLGGAGLYHCEYTELAEVDMAAASRDQARIMLGIMVELVIRSPRMTQRVFSARQVALGKRMHDVLRFKPTRGLGRIEHFQGGFIKIWAADDSTADGVQPTLALIDELHRHKDLTLYRTWRGKLDKRGGQIAAISTAGEPGSDFEDARDKIRENAPEASRRPGFTRVVYDNLVMHEYRVHPDADVTDFTVVKAANPLRQITPKSLAKKYASPTMKLTHWRRMTCNLPTVGHTTAVTEAEWLRANPDDDDHSIPENQRIWLGFDYAPKWDTTAAVPFWMPELNRRIFGPALVLVPPMNGDAIDSGQIKRGLVVIHQRNPIDTVVMDISRAEMLAAWMEETLGCRVIDRSQSNTAAVEDYALFIEALANDWIRHQGDQALSRHVLNAIAKTLPFGDTRFDRPSSSRQGGNQFQRVIDALTAASMVHTEAVREFAAEPEEVSAYAEDPRRILI